MPLPCSYLLRTFPASELLIQRRTHECSFMLPSSSYWLSSLTTVSSETLRQQRLTLPCCKVQEVRPQMKVSVALCHVSVLHLLQVSSEWSLPAVGCAVRCCEFPMVGCSKCLIELCTVCSFCMILHVVASCLTSPYSLPQTHQTTSASRGCWGWIELCCVCWQGICCTCFTNGAKQSRAVNLAKERKRLIKSSNLDRSRKWLSSWPSFW